MGCVVDCSDGVHHFLPFGEERDFFSTEPHVRLLPPPKHGVVSVVRGGAALFALRVEEAGRQRRPDPLLHRRVKGGQRGGE